MTLHALMTFVDIVVPGLLTMFAVACWSTVYWLIHGLDNEDAGR